MTEPRDPFADLDFPGQKPRRVVDITPAETTDSDAWDSKPLVMMLNNVETEFFQIGDLARALGRRPVTLRQWEAERILPLAQYRTAPPKGEQVPGKKVQGKRLYTRAQIEIILDAARQVGLMSATKRSKTQTDWSRFTSLIVDGWLRLR